jgi:hypothetical protein
MGDGDNGHACQLTRTNSHGVIAVCTCGWYGIVHPTYRKVRDNGRRGRRVFSEAEKAATIEHGGHARASRPLTATLAPEQFLHIVHNTSRFGHA